MAIPSSVCIHGRYLFSWHSEELLSGHKSSCPPSPIEVVKVEQTKR